jgi:4-amino-4-deoxy-L-arabinose transferase-like glycosyltransferase
MARRGGLWCDEAQFLWIVRMPTFQGMIDFLWHHESHPPLFYILMRGWLRVFGDSEPAALAMPILFGAALIPAAYHVGNRVFAGWTGVIAALLVATAPLLANYSGYVRPYSLLPLLCLGSVYLLWRGIGGAGATTWAAQAIINLAMLLTHNWAWMVLGAEAVVVGICLVAGRLSIASFRRWFVAQVVVVAAYAPWVPILIYQARYAGYGPRPVNLLEAASVFAEMMTSLPPPIVVLGLMLSVGVAGIWRLRDPSAKTRVWQFVDEWGTRLLLFAGIPTVAYLAAVILSYRSNLYHKVPCPIMLAPCIMVVIAFFISRWSSWPRLFGGLLALAYLLIALQFLGWQKSNTSTLAAEVAVRAEPSDIVVITPCWFSSSFAYYFQGNNLTLVYPYNFANGSIFYDRLRDRLLDPELVVRFRLEVNQARQAGRRIWLVRLNEMLDLPRISVECDAVPREFQNLTFSDLGYCRAEQVTEIIESIFGKPVYDICPNRDRGRLEILRASLYCRGDTRERSDNRR